MADYETILVTIDGGVALLTLNRPDRANSFNLVMDREFHEAMWALEADPAVRVIVVTGAGRAFCGGVDLEAGAGVFGEEAHKAHDETLGLDADSLPERSAFWKMRTPIIGAINGAAVGAGLTVPLLFDINYAAADAKLGFVFVRRGIFPEANSTWLLPRLIGVPRALELLLSGRMFTGEEAAAMGLVARALPRDEVVPAALALAHDLAANTAPIPVGVVKNAVYRNLQELDRRRSMALETKIVWWLGTHPDAMEGVMSFVQKRPPQWKGDKRTPMPAEIAIGENLGSGPF
jgi:enoyl-CoA hydratase/carnithine racemase